MAMPYTTATAVLPPDLLAEIHKHFRGGCLYVPYRKSVSRFTRNLEIISLRRQGKCITDIAARYMITRRAVRYILEKAEARGALSQENIETASSNATRSKS
jgi:Mor family transcriptional regulator